MSLNANKFISTDFETLRDQLLSRLSQVTGKSITDLNESEIAVGLVELLSGVGDMLHFYINQVALEASLPTARQPASIYRLVKLIGYNIKERSAARGNITIKRLGGESSGDYDSYNITIPKYTKILSASGVPFLTYGDAQLPAITAGDPTPQVTVPIIQGTLTKVIVEGTGEPDQYVVLNNTTIDPSTLAVSSGVNLWEVVNTLVYSNPDDMHYTVETDWKGVTTIRFGDGIYGRNPIPGERITIEAVDCYGERGNTDANEVTVLGGTLVFDGTTTPVKRLEIYNEYAIQGGTDRADLDIVKEAAPAALSSLYRAMTKEDYIALIKSNGGVTHVNVWGEQEESPPNYWCMNWVNISATTTDSNGDLVAIEQNLEDSITDYLEQIQPVTVRLRFIEPEIIKSDITLTVAVDPSLDLGTVGASIQTILGAAFSNDSVDFNLDIRVGTIYKLLMGVTGVKWAHIDEMHRQDDVENTVTDIICAKHEIPKLGDLKIHLQTWTQEPTPDLYSETWCDNIPSSVTGG